MRFEEGFRGRMRWRSGLMHVYGRTMQICAWTGLACALGRSPGQIRVDDNVSSINMRRQIRSFDSRQRLRKPYAPLEVSVVILHVPSGVERYVVDHRLMKSTHVESSFLQCSSTVRSKS